MNELLGWYGYSNNNNKLINKMLQMNSKSDEHDKTDKPQQVETRRSSGNSSETDSPKSAGMSTKKKKQKTKIWLFYKLWRHMTTKLVLVHVLVSCNAFSVWYLFIDSTESNSGLVASNISITQMCVVFFFPDWIYFLRATRARIRKI